MRTALSIVAGLFFLAACSNRNKIPSNVIPRAKMQSILWDLIRADQFLNDFVLVKDSSLERKIESNKLYQQVFAIHEVSRDEFRESFSFYRNHPQLLKNILDSLEAKSAAPTAPTELIKPQVDTGVVRQRIDSARKFLRKIDK